MCFSTQVENDNDDKGNDNNNNKDNSNDNEDKDGLAAAAGGFVGIGHIGGGNQGGVGGSSFVRWWVVAVVGLVVVDSSRGACSGPGGMTVSGAVAAHGRLSQGHSGHVDEYLCML
jgi:hypothetical protein